MTISFAARGRHLVTLMIPSHIVAASSLPRTPNVKHDRAAVREQLLEQLHTKNPQSRA